VPVNSADLAYLVSHHVSARGLFRVVILNLEKVAALP
jgi:hypothetical protein